MSQSDLEAAFMVWLGQHPEIPTPVREHQFHPTRKWRFDACWPAAMFAVELEGVGRADLGPAAHLTREGFLKDAAKYEAAMLLGWTVYRIPAPWVTDGKRFTWRDETMAAIKTMLERGKGAG